MIFTSLNVFLVILTFVLVLSFLVIIHELGHFLVARQMGIKVEEFGLGYPPLAKKLFKWKETLFSLNWVPFGGFIRIKGENEANGYFQKFAASKRLAVILAGAVVNLLFGVVAFSIVFSFNGIPTPTQDPLIGYVAPDSPAAEANLPTEVKIIALEAEGERVGVDDTQEVIDYIAAHRGQTVSLITTGHCQAGECQESAHEHQVYLRTEDETPEGEGSLGIIFQGVILRQYPWYEMPFRGAWYGLGQAVWLSGMIALAVFNLFADLFTQGQVPADVAGPVGIVSQAVSADIISQGWAEVLHFAGVLSVNLAIMNLLPIPALDGGRAVFILLEKVLDKKRIEKIEAAANYGGFALLLSLIILITIRDVWRILT